MMNLPFNIANNNQQVIESFFYCQFFAGFRFRNGIKEVLFVSEKFSHQASSPSHFNKVSEEKLMSVTDYNLWISNQSISTSMVAVLHMLVLFQVLGVTCRRRKKRKWGMIREVKENDLDLCGLVVVCLFDFSNFFLCRCSFFIYV